MPEQRARSRRERGLLLAAALLVWLTGGLACFTAPPPPAATHPFAAQPASPQRALAAVPRVEPCRVVRRATRTWVSFARGMTLDDMVPAGLAAAAVVRALDTAVCALSRGERVPALFAHRARIRAAASNAGGFEVTKVLWQDAALSHAQVEIQSLRPSRDSDWLARVVRQGEAWEIASFATRARQRSVPPPE